MSISFVGLKAQPTLLVGDSGSSLEGRSGKCMNISLHEWEVTFIYFPSPSWGGIGWGAVCK